MRESAKLFKELRVKKNLSQRELATKLGYTSPQLVSNWERGLCNVPTKNLKTLVKILKARKDDVHTALITDYSNKILRHM